MLSFFPRGVLDEILNLIESVSEDFPSYSFIPEPFCDDISLYILVLSANNFTALITVSGRLLINIKK